MNYNTALAGLEILEGTRLALHGFQSLTRESGARVSEIDHYIAEVDRSLDALSAWMLRMIQLDSLPTDKRLELVAWLGEKTRIECGYYCANCRYFDVLSDHCRLEGWRTFPDTVCSKFEQKRN